MIVHIRLDPLPGGIRSRFLSGINTNYSAIVAVLEDQSFDRIDAHLKNTIINEKSSTQLIDAVTNPLDQLPEERKRLLYIPNPTSFRMFIKYY